MAVVTYGSASRDFQLVRLGTGLTVNGDTPDMLDRGTLRRPGLLQVLSVIGASPTVTLNVLGSVDGTNFFNVAYALAATPETVTVAAITITTATTSYFVLRDARWTRLKVNLSAINNVTLTLDVAA